MSQPKLTAVTLKYESDNESAPRLTSKGQGFVAEEIIKIAKANGIPLREDPELVTLLATLDLDQQIPEALYIAVAEVLAFAYELNNQINSDDNGSPSIPLA